MITKTSVASATAYAAALAKAGITLSSVKGTLLSNVVSSFSDKLVLAHNVDTDIGADPITNSQLISNLIYDASVSDNGMSPHDSAKGDAVSLLSKSVTGQIKFIRSVVLPAVREYESMVRDKLSTYKYFDNPLSNFNVLPIVMPELSSEVISELAGYDGPYTGELVTPPYSMPAITNDSITELLKIGDNEYDAMIDNLVSVIGLETITKTYNEVFADRMSSTANDTTLYERYIKSLIVYLVARKLEVEVADIEVPSSVDYLSTMNLIKERAGNIANKTKSMVEQIIVSGVMVDEVITDPSTNAVTVRVYEQNYADFLDHGGRVEALLGMVISGDTATTTHAINQSINKYVSALDNYVYLKKAASRYQYLDILKNTLRNSFVELFEPTTDEERSALASNVGYMNNVSKYLEDEISEITVSDIDRLDIICRKIIARARFYYTDADDFLNEMTAVGNENDKLIAEEAAMITAVHYLVDFLAEQISIGGR